MAEPIQPTSPGVEPVETSPASYSVGSTGTATAVIPAAETVVIETAAPKKKRRWWVLILVLAIVAVLLVVGFFIADAFAKQFATGYVRDRIVAVLNLDPKTPVDVDLGDGSMIFQAIKGSVDEVTVGIDTLTFGDITGAAVLTATGVPLDSAKPVDTLGVTMTITEENVKKLSGFMSGIDLKSIDLQDGIIRVQTDFTLLFFTIPISVDLLPSAVEGGIGFAPQTILLGEEPISVADLRASPEFSALAGNLLNTQVFCVASYLPQALAIDDVDVVGTDLVVSINGDGAVLSGAGLSTNGTCPA